MYYILRISFKYIYQIFKLCIKDKIRSVVLAVDESGGENSGSRC